ncbi:MAG: hypothetical protein IPJ08_14455 [Burkholderiales bacterium]|nr:hypothetical protein [Burkholderiales bacterium]
MKFVLPLIVSSALILAATASQAQFVKGNEAVKVMQDGSKKVDTPPLPAATLAKPCPASQPGCAGGGWLMVETSEGLQECTEIYARPSTCRASTYGTEKRSRLWIVRSGAQWLQCQYPDLSSKCVSTKGLPMGAVQ